MSDSELRTHCLSKAIETLRGISDHRMILEVANSYFRFIKNGMERPPC